MTDYFVRKYSTTDYSFTFFDAKRMAETVKNAMFHTRFQFITDRAVETARICTERQIRGRRCHYVAVEMDKPVDSCADMYYGRLIDVIEFKLEWF